jgi:hypothetical protein
VLCSIDGDDPVSSFVSPFWKADAFLVDNPNSLIFLDEHKESRACFERQTLVPAAIGGDMSITSTPGTWSDKFNMSPTILISMRFVHR